MLCELRDAGISSDDRAYSLSCNDIDHNVESKFTRSLLHHIKVEAGMEVFEKILHLSSKHGAHGLSRISKGTYWLHSCTQVCMYVHIYSTYYQCWLT